MGQRTWAIIFATGAALALGLQYFNVFSQIRQIWNLVTSEQLICIPVPAVDGNSKFLRTITPVHPGEEGDALLIVDRILPPQTIVNFFSFSNHGLLPNGKRTSLPLLAEEEVVLLTKPYEEWALAPNNQRKGIAAEDVMIRIGSYEDSSRLVLVEKHIQHMKSRLWEGIEPLTARHWQKKRLDDPENFLLACQHLASVIEAFCYLNLDGIKYNLRETYNLIYDHFKEFEDALNGLRETKGKVPISVTALWEDYINALYTSITTRAHWWFTSHIEELRKPLLQQLREHQPNSTEVYSAEQWELTNKIHDLAELASRADFSIFMPMDGYKGHKLTGLEPSSSIWTRQEFYGPRLKERTREIIYGDPQRIKVMMRPFGDPESILSGVTAQIQAQREVSIELRGEPESVGPPAWALSLQKSHPYNVNWKPEPGSSGDFAWDFGFAVYRLTYGKHESDDEWDSFVREFEKDIDANWREVVGAPEELQGKASVNWFMGRDYGIMDHDIDGAKRHFLTMRESLPRHYSTTVFLVIDFDSLHSYDTYRHFGVPGRHVLAVDPDFDPNEPNEHAEESPGFTGEMRILTSLLWSDLYALTASQTQFLEDMWPLAMDQPGQVYVGPTVPLMRRKPEDIINEKIEKAKREMNELINGMLKE